MSFSAHTFLVKKKIKKFLFIKTILIFLERSTNAELSLPRKYKILLLQEQVLKPDFTRTIHKIWVTKVLITDIKKKKKKSNIVAALTMVVPVLSSLLIICHKYHGSIDGSVIEAPI